MLTKQDLQQIESLLIHTEERINLITEKEISKSTGNLEERLSQKVEQSAQRLQKEISLLKTEMKKEFRKVHSDQNLIIKHFNKEFLGLQDRVDKVEQKIKSPSFN